MGYEQGDLKTMQSGKEIDLNTTLPAMIDFRDSLRQAKTGMIRDVETEFTDNQKRLNQVRGLSLLISSQETLITLSRAQIEFRSKVKWEKNNKNKKEKEKEPFIEDCDVDWMKYDYSKLLYWSAFLKFCRREILTAEKTKKTSDDFLIIEQREGEDVFRLTENFWEMLETLETSFSKIQMLMLVNKVISSGVEEDEELTYKEQELMFIERVRDA